MNTLQEHLRGGFDGILVFGDVHGDFTSFMRVVNYAKSQNYFLLSLGDLVDRDRCPFEVVTNMARLIKEGRAGFTIGNHDDKMYRYAKGAKVSFSLDSKQTLADVGEARMEEFLSTYVDIIDDKAFSNFYHKFDDIVLVHAAAHKAMWEDNHVMTKSEQNRYMVGETNGERYSDGYPVRLYNWVNDIPMGKTVIVGHDKQPIHNIPITEAMIIRNSAGGRAVFLDTGGGKGGFLSGAVIVADKKLKFKISEFVSFENEVPVTYNKG